MPKLGESITEGTIVSWSVKVGDIIQEDDVLFEVNPASEEVFSLLSAVSFPLAVSSSDASSPPISTTATTVRKTMFSSR